MIQEDKPISHGKCYDCFIGAACVHTLLKPVAMSQEDKPVSTQPRLTVRLMGFPESNGKRNWTALLVRVDDWGGLIGNCGGITVARGELWNRVAYAAERAKLLIGERDTEPNILDYGDDIATPDQWAGEVRGGFKVAGGVKPVAAQEPVTVSDPDILRRIAERGLRLAQERGAEFIDLFQHMLDEIARQPRPVAAQEPSDVSWLNGNIPASITRTEINDHAAPCANPNGDEYVCDECNGTGWCYNAVEGRYPCVCMTEAEPYQLLESKITEQAAEIERLKSDRDQWRIKRDVACDTIERMKKERSIRHRDCVKASDYVAAITEDADEFNAHHDEMLRLIDERDATIERQRKVIEDARVIIELFKQVGDGCSRSFISHCHQSANITLAAISDLDKEKSQ